MSMLPASLLPCLVFAPLVLASGAGCANTKFHKATDPTVNGIRYYRPATYILVKPDYEKGAASVTFFAGPDTSEPHAIDPFAFAAKNDTDIQLNHGMLSKVTSDTDSTKLAVDTLKAVGEVAKSALQTAAAAAGAAAMRAQEVERTPGPVEPPIFLFKAGKDGFVQLFPLPRAAERRAGAPAPAADPAPAAAPGRPRG